MVHSEIFHELLVALAEVYQNEPDPAGQHTAKTLLITPSPHGFDPIPATIHDIKIRNLLAQSPHQAAAKILACQDRLPWDTNPVEANTETTIASMISVMTLMGPEGPIPAPDVRMGLVYMQPDCYYPLHIHDADETYVILAGGALWTAGDDVRYRSVGSMVHHPSLMPHAFKTGAEGFIALWRWSGDINTESYAFIEDAVTEVHA